MQRSDILFVIAFACLLSCNQKADYTTKEIDRELSNLSEDSAEQLAQLEEEILFRKADTTGSVPDFIEITDSVLVWGDTLSWKVITRRVAPNEELQGYPTDSLTKLFGKKVIYENEYGLDSRKDWDELIIDSQERRTALQTACLVRRSKLVRRADGMFELNSRTFSEAKRLCTAERFFDQPVGGFCSGFAVGERLLVTAGHCVKSVSDLHSFYVVFNFRKEAPGSFHTLFTPDEVYTPIALVESVEDANGHDFAVIRLDRVVPVERRATVSARRIRHGEKVFVVGHPCGLPLKFADGARVVDNTPEDYFLADLDTYGGNSGSPVYDTAHQVVGILVRGAVDFLNDYTNNCKYSHVCRSVQEPGCKGEVISRTHQFLPYIGTGGFASVAVQDDN